MSCQRSPPPSSPRAPKIQQESWDDCDSPPIDLFNPCHHKQSPLLPSSSPIASSVPPKSPKSPRKFNKPIISQTPPYCDISSRHSPKSTSSRSSYHSTVTSNPDQRSPKYDNSPRSPKITTTYANDDDDDDDDDNRDRDYHDNDPFNDGGDIRLNDIDIDHNVDNDDDDDICGGDNDNDIDGIVNIDIGSKTGSYYHKTTVNSRNSKHQQQQLSSPRRSPKSPRKFVFDAISPSFEKKARKFDYYNLDDTNPEDADIESIDQDEPDGRYVRNHPLRCQTPPKSSSIHHHQQQLQQQQHASTSIPSGLQNSYGGNAGGGMLHQRRDSKNFNSNYFKSPDIGVSFNGNKMSKERIGISLNHGNASGGSGRFHSHPHHPSHHPHHNHHHHNQQQQQQQQTIISHHLDEFPTGNRSALYIKRDSCMTESTQLSGDSCETNATTLTTTTTFISSTSTDDGGIIEPSPPTSATQSSSCNRNHVSGGNSGGGGAGIVMSNNGGQSSPKCTVVGVTGASGSVGGGSGGGISSTAGSDKVSSKKDSGKRKHAINITSNPAYQVLHGSHSTLDRTCSDSVVSLKYRKSTSDLTDVDDGQAPIMTTKPRRRGSSKGGLAYLASRRSSRDSVKSICSNTSNFSNEDIGPLAFQSSSRSRQRRTSNFLELPIPDHIRPRVCSLPDRPYNPRVSDDLYRLRHFSISKGTVVNCGDSIISRRSKSNTSVNSTTSRASERSPFEGSCCGGGYANVDSMPPSPTDSEPPPPPRYRIVMLGDAGVGKTALVSQFMTSEYMHTYDASLDDEFGEKTVSVLLDDEESELVFIDHPSVEMSVENSLTTYEPHACVVTYSVVNRNSFRVAEEIINYLWSENITKDKAVILVGNKADLARSRVITMSEGKSLAASRDAKFIETSSGIQHNVDELLVGILKQIRLKERRDKKAAMTSSKMKNSRTQISLHLAKEILQKICLSDITKSKSCENLHVL